LLLGTASAAYPWPAWVKAKIASAAYYGYGYNSVYTPLYSFNPSLVSSGEGLHPTAGLTAGNGFLLGTSNYPGGRAFALFPTGSGPYSEAVIAALGAGPVSSLTPISQTQLVGTDHDSAFMLTQSGASVTKTVLFSFPAGTAPNSALSIDATGTLYGTASGSATGTKHKSGFVYALSPVGDGTYTATVALDFKLGLVGGSHPQGVTVGADGSLYGATAFGGTTTCTYGTTADVGCGVVYRLTNVGGTWTEKVIYRFAGGLDGAGPGEVTLDASGAIYGATVDGGNGQGMIYKITPAAGGTVTKEVKVYTFANTADGHTPNTKITLDQGGAIYGTAQGGAGGQGTVFIAIPTVKKKTTTYALTVLHSFAGFNPTSAPASHKPHAKVASSDGAQPSGGLIIDSTGTLFGVTTYGGTSGQGSVYSLLP